MDSIGRYRLEGRIGAGSFATVWKGHDDDLDVPRPELQLAACVQRSAGQEVADWTRDFERGRVPAPVGDEAHQ